jgi:hypothetical protein
MLETSIKIMEAMKNKDIDGIKSFIYDEVRFSPYSYVDMNNDIVLSNEELDGIFFSEEIYSWGNFDGSGEPIEMNFADYYDEFIYDEDYQNPQIIGVNSRVSYSNIIDNISESYPESEFVEYHFKGFDPQYEGMDWSSLILVFKKVDTKYYLVGVIHGQWTI